MKRQKSPREAANDMPSISLCSHPYPSGLAEFIGKWHSADRMVIDYNGGSRDTAGEGGPGKVPLLGRA